MTELTSYTLLSEEPIPETNSHARLYTHRKTGARVLVLSNDDPNKVFTVGFRTPPVDSTGSPHIVEHCVLSGSRKYQTKEPFMDLLKGSLQTFLNAMTFPDKTIYPVASRNDKDFHNLMDVYLDAVFHPAIYHDERIFRQEGWHYTLEDQDAELGLSGVVYNEMRGAYSDPTSVLFAELMAGIFKDTEYAFESGGDPYIIPELTYEDFLAFHKRYYHPSNSYIYLYGDMDVEATLSYIDEAYLNDFEQLEIDSTIKRQTPFTEPVYRKARYSVSEGSPTIDKNYLAWAVMAGESVDTLGSLRRAVLNDLLFDNESAPVKQALVEAGLAEDVRGFSEDLQQGLSGVFLVNAKDGSQEAFVRIVEDAIEKQVQQGFDPEIIRSTLNRMEYSRRECEGYPTRGIIYGIRSYDTWLYDGDPFEALRYEGDFEALRSEIEAGAYEDWARQIYLENPHKLILEIEPEVGLNDRRDEQVKEALQAQKASMSEAEIQTMVQDYEDFTTWQGAPETEEAKATIPALTLDDVNRELTHTPRVEIQLPKSKATLLQHPLFTSGITYFDMSFDYGFVPDEDLPYVSVLAMLLGSISTEELHYTALETQTFLVSGGIGTSARILRRVNGDDQLSFCFYVSAKTMDPQIESLMPLVLSILTRTRFDEEARIKELMARTRTWLEKSIVNNGHSYGLQRADSYIRHEAALNDQLGGLSYYFWLDQTLKQWEENWPTLQAKLIDLSKRIFTRDDVVAQITADEEAQAQATAAIDQCLSQLPSESEKPAERHFEPKIRNEAILTGSNVQYICQIADYEAMDTSYHGAMEVVATYLSRGYLHNQIRAQGGAYGAGLRVGTYGHLGAYSYRDPEVQRTLDVYGQMADQLLNLDLSEEELTTYIVGSMNRFDPPQTPQAKGASDMAQYLSGRSRETRQRWLDEALATDLEKMRELGQLLKQGFSDQKIYVAIGNSSRLQKDKTLFLELITLSE